MVLKNVALTGASGMVGRHIYDALASSGSVVIPSCRNKPPWMDSGAWVHWDLTEWNDKQAFEQKFGQADVLIHAGATIPQTDFPETEPALFDANVRACLNLGHWALGSGLPIIYISSATVYAEPYSTNITETMPRGRNRLGGFYGLTKFFAEEIFNHLRERGLSVAILRPSSIYGTGLPQIKLLWIFLNKALRGETIDITPPSDDKIDLLHTSDLARAVLEVIKKERWETFNVASERPVSVVDIAEACFDVVGSERKINVTESKTCDPTVRFGLECNLAHERLGWYPLVTLRKGLAMMLRQETLLKG